MRRIRKKREQKTIVNPTLPIQIGKDYVFIRQDKPFLIGSKILQLCAVVTLSLFFRFFGRHKIINQDNIKKLNRSGFISISNHCHYLDGALNTSCLGFRNIWFPSVQRNFETPYLRKVLRALKGFPIPEHIFGLSQIMKPCVAAINRGEIVHFYPEEELWHLHRGIGDFHLGAFYLAHKAKCPVVPIVHLLKPMTFFGKVISREILSIKSVIGKPMYPSGIGKLDDNTIDRESINSMADRAKSWMEAEVLVFEIANNLS